MGSSDSQAKVQKDQARIFSDSQAKVEEDQAGIFGDEL